MARISGVELPNNKKIEYALPYVYGIGLTLSKKIIGTTDIDPNKRVRELADDEVAKL